jgi:electron transport complex protein RnfD
MTAWLPAFAPDRFTRLPSSTLTLPFTQPVYDAVTSATPLALWKFERVSTDARELALGFVGGSTGETSAVLILLGGAYLVARNMMSWRIPVGVLGMVAGLSGLLHELDPQRHAPAEFMLLSGGVMLGAVFMATDMVASPMTATGQFIYGALIGAITVVIRTWGGMPEGVMYAILLANAVSPHIDRAIRPRVYGTRRPWLP